MFLTAMGLGLGGYVDGSTTQHARWGLVPGVPRARAARRDRCSRRPSRPRSRSWTGSTGAGSSTRCTRRRSGRGTSRSATSLDRGADDPDRDRLTIVIVLFGAAESPLVVFAIPVAVLTGLAFAAPLMAFSATQRTPTEFAAIFRFGITPLFLFSGTFYPVEIVAGLHPAPRLDHPAVAWRRPVPRVVARDHRRQSPTIALALVGLARSSSASSGSGAVLRRCVLVSARLVRG